MKIIKNLLIVLGVLLVLFVVVTFFLPTKFTVTRTIKINAPVSVVFDQVNTLKNWEKWSIWYAMDPMQKLSYSGPECGTGACYVWNSANSDVGSGKLTILESQPYTFINTKLESNDMGAIESPWTFKEEDNITVVTMTAKGELAYFNKWLGLMLDSYVGNNFEKSLASLKKASEAAPKVNVKISITNADPQTILAVSETTTLNPQDIAAAMQKAYGEIMTFMKNNNLEMAGPPLAINNSYDNGRYEFDAGIPINTTKVTTAGRIKLKTTTAGKVVKGIAVGPYENSELFYKAIEQYIRDNKLSVRGKSWEEYINDPGNTPKDQLVTHIYFPIYEPE